MNWIDHGGRNEPDLKSMANKASVIFVATIKLNQKLPVEFSEGDVHIPTIWKMDVSVLPEKVLKGKISGTLHWTGRFRPDYPDPAIEDLFWKEWSKNVNKKVIVFLSENTAQILHIELYTESIMKLLVS